MAKLGIWPRLRVIVVALFVAVLGSYAAAWVYDVVSTFEALNPFQNVGISHELTPVEITFATPSDTMRWRIPKAYITDKTNWPGGEQDFIEIEAALYWDSPDMPPFAIAGDPRGPGPKPDDEINIALTPTGEFSNDSLWTEYVLKDYAPAGTRGDLTVYHDINPRSSSSVDHVFAPTVQAEHVIYFECAVNAGDVLANCEADVNFSEDIALKYIFDSKYLDRWREIDARVRRLVGSFLLSGGGPRAVTEP